MTAIENHPMGKYLDFEVERPSEDINGVGRVTLFVDPDGGIQLYDASIYICCFCPQCGDYINSAYADIINALNDGMVEPMGEEVAHGLGIEL